jgi:hypothetical protein
VPTFEKNLHSGTQPMREGYKQVLENNSLAHNRLGHVNKKILGKKGIDSVAENNLYEPCQLGN